MRIDYAQALDGSRSMDVRLTSGESVAVHRQALRGFIQLKSLESDIADALEKKDVPRVESSLRKYIQTGAGLATYSGLDVFRLFLVVTLVNRLGGSLAIIETTISKEDKPEDYDYPHRVYALWVHQLATAYHWSRNEILSLYPDEVLCYLQEIMHDNWKEKEWEWELAGFGWSHGKDGAATRNQFPAPAWAEKKTVIPKTKLYKSFLPKGAVVDMGGVGVFTEENNVGESGIRDSGDNPVSGGTTDGAPVPVHPSDSD